MQQGFAEKIIYRLVRKNIAGPTMKSAIGRVKLLNAKGIPASVSFLSNNPDTRAKCNYITSVYMQLARELSRLSLRAGIHLTIEQLGSGIDNSIALQNLNKVIETCNKKGIVVWCSADGNTEVVGSIKKTKGVGIAFESIESALDYAKTNTTNMLKVRCRYENEKEKHDIAKDIEKIMASAKNIVLLAPNEGLIKHLLKNGKYKKSLIFEFQLGYSDKKISKLVKRGARVSVYVPFGKDWIDYAMGNMPEGYMKRIVSGILKDKGVDDLG